MPQIAVAIVNYNTREYLRACLMSVQAEAAGEVVVVDNASSDGSAAMVREEFPWVTLHANDTNLGYGTAANQAIASCTAEYVLLLNSDTLLLPTTLEALSMFLDAHPRAAVVGPRLVKPSGKLQSSAFEFPTPSQVFFEEIRLSRMLRYIPILRNRYLGTWSHDRVQVMPWVLGAALAIRREAFEAVGGFDESIFMYFEETDLCYRLSTAGWQTYYAPVATIMHVGGASTKQRSALPRVRWFIGLDTFYRRHYSRLHQIELIVLIRLMALARLLRDILRMWTAPGASERARIAADVKAWGCVSSGHWPDEYITHMSLKAQTDQQPVRENERG